LVDDPDIETLGGELTELLGDEQRRRRLGPAGDGDPDGGSIGERSSCGRTRCAPGDHPGRVEVAVIGQAPGPAPLAGVVGLAGRRRRRVHVEVRGVVVAPVGGPHEGDDDEPEPGHQGQHPQRGSTDR
jgi:hypothetical protein